jgi:hypothetical protein
MDALDAPLGQLIAAIGRSVADAQRTLDGRAIEHFGAIYDQSSSAFEPLRAIGYQPTWYQIREASAEIRLAISLGRAQGGPGADPARPRELHGAPVDAGYQSRFNYRRDTASSLKFRIVPVPPPAAAELLVTERSG